jgi:O-antigen/teichoic acid export membrane protein
MTQSTTRSQFAGWFAPETLVQSLGIGLLLTVVSRLAALGRGVLFARLMDRAELGTWALTNNTMQMLSIVLVLGIPAGLCRYVSRYQRDGQLRPFLARALGASGAVCVVVCAVGIVFCRPLARFVYEDANRASLAILLCLGALALMALNLFQGVLQGLRVYRINAVMLGIQSIGFVGLAAVLFAVLRPTALVGAWAFLIVSVVVTAVPIWMLCRSLRIAAASDRAAAPTEIWKPLLVYSIGTWGSSALFSLWMWLDRYMLLHFDTLSSAECLQQLGTYHIVENLAGPLGALGAGWSIQVLAHTVHLWETGNADQAGRLVQLATKLTVLALTFVAAGIVVFKRFLLAGIFGDTTMASGEILEWVLIAAIVLAAQCMVRSYVLCHERAWVVSVAWIAAVALSFGLNLLLIPVLHLHGATITAAASALASTWLLMGFTHRAGLRLAASTWLATALPFVLLLPPHWMLLALATAVLAIAKTEWLLSHDDKAMLNATIGNMLASRFRLARASA